MSQAVVRMASLAAAVAGVVGLVAPAQAQEAKVTLGMSGWTGFAPLTLADKAGIFKKNGLDVELKMIPQKDRHLALASKAIQCAATTVETHVAWNTNGVPIVQIFQLDKSYGADGLAVRNEVAQFRVAVQIAAQLHQGGQVGGEGGRHHKKIRAVSKETIMGANQATTR